MNLCCHHEVIGPDAICNVFPLFSLPFSLGYFLNLSYAELAWIAETELGYVHIWISLSCAIFVMNVMLVMRREKEYVAVTR